MNLRTIVLSWTKEFKWSWPLTVTKMMKESWYSELLINTVVKHNSCMRKQILYRNY